MSPRGERDIGGWQPAQPTMGQRIDRWHHEEIGVTDGRRNLRRGRGDIGGVAWREERLTANTTFDERRAGSQWQFVSMVFLSKVSMVWRGMGTEDMSYCRGLIAVFVAVGSNVVFSRPLHCNKYFFGCN